MILTTEIWYGDMTWAEEDSDSSVGQIDMNYISLQTREARKASWGPDTSLLMLE